VISGTTSWVSVLVGISSVAACTQIGGETECDGCLIDAGSLDDALVPVDSAFGSSPDAAGLGLFGEPRLIAEVSLVGQHDDDPSVTADLLELYFASDRPGGAGSEDLWVSTRATTEDVWGAPQPVAALNSTAIDDDPDISADGLEIYFSSYRFGGTGASEVWRSTRASRAEPFDPPIVVAELNSTVSDWAPAVTPDGLALVLHSRRGDNIDLYLSTRTDVGQPWSTPVPVAEVNSPSIDSDAFLAADRLNLYFSSRRSGGQGNSDLYLASRATTDEPFGTPGAIREISGASNDSDPMLTLDQRNLFFSSDRTGDREIFQATR
jgi:Tol biopolymer transport system component